MGSLDVALLLLLVSLSLLFALLLRGDNALRLGPSKLWLRGVEGTTGPVTDVESVPEDDDDDDDRVSNNNADCDDGNADWDVEEDKGEEEEDTAARF